MISGAMRGAAAGWLAGLALACASCEASVPGGGDDTSGPPDAPRFIGDPDAAAIDARPCTGGDAAMIDPSTGTCYVAFIMTRLPWLEARAQCTAIGMDLAVITSQAENTFLTGFLGGIEAFVGGDDRASEGTFRWVDGMSITYENWRDNPDPNPDEPNNGNGNYQEDCIVLQGQLAGVWDDRPCDSTEVTPPAGTHYALCEYP